MRIVVVGPGAIGCLLSSLLIEAEYDVVLLDKDPDRAKLLTKQGVLIEKNGKTRSVRVPAKATTEEIGEADFICLCVKSFDSAVAMKHSKPLLGKKTIIVSLQNGVGNAEEISKIVQGFGIVCVATSHGSTSLGIGHVRHAGEGTTLASSYGSGKAEAGSFARLLRNAGIPTEVMDDAQSMIWSKLVVNAAINPVTALSDIPNGKLFMNNELAEMALAAAAEAYAVAKAKGIYMPYPDAGAVVRDVCQATADNISSMLQDVRTGRRTEVDAINGAVVKEARKVKVPTPVNEMLLKKVQKLERQRKIR